MESAASHHLSVAEVDHKEPASSPSKKGDDLDLDGLGKELFGSPSQPPHPERAVSRSPLPPMKSPSSNVS